MSREGVPHPIVKLHGIVAIDWRTGEERSFLGMPDPLPVDAVDVDEVATY